MDCCILFSINGDAYVFCIHNVNVINSEPWMLHGYMAFSSLGRKRGWADSTLRSLWGHVQKISTTFCYHYNHGGRGLSINQYYSPSNGYCLLGLCHAFRLILHVLQLQHLISNVPFMEFYYFLLFFIEMEYSRMESHLYFVKWPAPMKCCTGNVRTRVQVPSRREIFVRETKIRPEKSQ